MKVFFNASLTGKRTFLQEYQAVFDALTAVEKVKLLHSPVMVGSLKKLSEETLIEAVGYFKKLERWIKSADVVVFEASYPSMGIGHEVAMALQFEKPVIVLHLPGKRPDLLTGIPNDKLQILEYTTLELRAILQDALSYAADQQDTRFNFFISPKIGNYLDWVSKKRRLPRAVYLRKLIEEDMKKNKDFEE